MRALALTLTMGAALAEACATDFDCSLNGVCGAGVCACDAPWGGAACEKLVYAVTPASGKNLWTGSDQLNTWNGPIVTGPDGTYHLFDPVYEHASLWNVMYYAHGTSKAVEGPYDWSSSPNISSTAINPAALTFPNASSPSGALVYSLWIGSDILVASDPAGPFNFYARNPLPGNTATAFANGKIYAMNQANHIQMATSLAGPWTAFSTITHPAGMPYTVEDPCVARARAAPAPRPAAARKRGPHTPPLCARVPRLHPKASFGSTRAATFTPSTTRTILASARIAPRLGCPRIPSASTAPSGATRTSLTTTSSSSTTARRMPTARWSARRSSSTRRAC